MTGAQGQLVDVGAGRRQADRSHPGCRRDLVNDSDDGQDRAFDVGQRHQLIVDREAALEHSVVGDELAQEVGHRRPRPGDPAVGLQEAPLALTREQGLAIVQLQDEVDPAAQRLDRVKQAKARPAGPRRQRPGSEHAIGEQLRDAGGELLRDTEWHPQPGVDRTAEGDHRGESLVAAVCGHLVAEHPPLRVAPKVHVMAGDLPHALDCVRDGQDVVSERPLQPALLPLGRAEVHHPRVGSVAVEDRHGARRRGYVVDLGRQHHGRHQQHRRTGGWSGGVAVVVVVTQAVDALLADHLIRRRLLFGVQAAEAGHFERILRGSAEPGHRPGDRLRQQLWLSSSPLAPSQRTDRISVSGGCSAFS